MDLLYFKFKSSLSMAFLHTTEQSRTVSSMGHEIFGEFKMPKELIHMVH